MINPITKIDAINKLYGQDSYHMADANGKVKWRNGHETTAEETTAINAEVIRLQAVVSAEYDAQEYARNRQEEYPTIAELTVALYDTDDRSAIDAKRAAVKAKFPKP